MADINATNVTTDVTTNQEGQVTDTNATQNEENKTYTEAEVMEMLQKETDRRVTEALKKQERKNNAKIAEAQKLASMNEAEKYEYQLKQREEAIAAKERELAMLENKNEASKILNEKGLSLALVDFIVAEDAETMKANIDLLDRAFKASVKAEVEKRLGGAAPKKNPAIDKQLTKQDFAKLSYADMMTLKQTDPTLFAELSR
nr:MAG TPA: capsid scaffolding protein [Caudoviricetes sp.]